MLGSTRMSMETVKMSDVREDDWRLFSSTTPSQDESFDQHVEKIKAMYTLSALTIQFVDTQELIAQLKRTHRSLKTLCWIARLALNEYIEVAEKKTHLNQNIKAFLVKNCGAAESQLDSTTKTRIAIEIWRGAVKGKNHELSEFIAEKGFARL